MGRPSRFSPEVRERAVRMVEEHRATHASEWGRVEPEHVGHALMETMFPWGSELEEAPVASFPEERIDLLSRDPVTCPPSRLKRALSSSAMTSTFWLPVRNASHT